MGGEEEETGLGARGQKGSVNIFSIQLKLCTFIYDRFMRTFYNMVVVN